MTVKYMDAKRIQGLSSDTKPTNVPAGSIYVETDTFYYSWFDGTTWTQPARGLFCGGYNQNISALVNTIEYIAIQTTGNGTDFGDLTALSNSCMGGGNGTRGVIALGNTGGDVNIIDYITMSTLGNASDFGDLTEARGGGAGGLENGTRLVFAAGNPSTEPNKSNVIDYITVASTGNATDFGDAQTAAYGKWSGVNNSTRGCYAGGYAAAGVIDEIDYITIATTGNASDFGDLSTSGYNGAGGDNQSRGVFCAGIMGSASNTMEYITIATTGNCTDFGDRTIAKNHPACVCDDTRICIGGGQTVDTIDYITTATTGNATDFGDMTETKYALGACDTQ